MPGDLLVEGGQRMVVLFCRKNTGIQENKSAHSGQDQVNNKVWLDFGQWIPVQVMGGSRKPGPVDCLMQGISAKSAGRSGAMPDSVPEERPFSCYSFDSSCCVFSDSSSAFWYFFCRSSNLLR